MLFGSCLSYRSFLLKQVLNSASLEDSALGNSSTLRLFIGNILIEFLRQLGVVILICILERRHEREQGCGRRYNTKSKRIWVGILYSISEKGFLFDTAAAVRFLQLLRLALFRLRVPSHGTCRSFVQLLQLSTCSSS